MKLAVSPFLAAIPVALLPFVNAAATACAECLAERDRLDLFGGSIPWNASQWTSQDDR